MSPLCAATLRADSPYQAAKPGFEVVGKSRITALSDCGADELRFRNSRQLRRLLESRL
jgi:hypothetical protein